MSANGCQRVPANGFLTTGASNACLAMGAFRNWLGKPFFIFYGCKAKTKYRIM